MIFGLHYFDCFYATIGIIICYNLDLVYWDSESCELFTNQYITNGCILSQLKYTTFASNVLCATFMANMFLILHVVPYSDWYYPKYDSSCLIGTRQGSVFGYSVIIFRCDMILKGKIGQNSQILILRSSQTINFRGYKLLLFLPCNYISFYKSFQRTG